MAGRGAASGGARRQGRRAASRMASGGARRPRAARGVEDGERRCVAMAATACRSVGKSGSLAASICSPRVNGGGRRRRAVK